ncbi:helix-turn-helix domain-containing protein [Saccharopolyspora phatthalungensis]|uniref:Transcriptional regulator with XRE-family HTH domain n=1 Tax=Saccharopolyspora phatthalungensis TaxID=664693 RepID=A0A840QJK7_9PSEU|nr:helix-turn-helix transcriptional regulator [Saccharopolyspora phatthalungensis]MBB5159438.1 transcriptional regulator with XRE-family HTH domain [Saccharopolyspora phatthalungensis]
MARSKAGSPKARTLGAELRKARESKGVTVRELARRLGIGHAWVVRTEAGSRPATTEDVTAILVALGISGGERERIVELAREADGPDWLRGGIPGVHQELVTLMVYERTATAISHVAPMLLPGMLQTADYARAVMTGLPPGEVETRVAMRATRRDILTSRKAPRFEALIGEYALTSPVLEGDPMIDQLRHLARVAEQPNVTIRVLPSLPRWTPAHEGRFIMFEFADAEPLVHLEHLGSAAFHTSPGVVETYSHALGTLREAAMTQEESLDLIAACTARYEESPR